MLDKKGKLFGKISIIDILIVCILVLAVAGALVAWQKINAGTVLTENKSLVQNSALDTLEISMRLKGVRQMTRDAISVGDEVYMKDTGKYLGEVVSVTSEPHKQFIYDSTGRPINAEVPEQLDVTIVLHVPGKRLSGGYYTADNIHLVHNSSFEIIMPLVQTTPVIESINTITGE